MFANIVLYYHRIKPSFKVVQYFHVCPLNQFLVCDLGDPKPGENKWFCYGTLNWHIKFPFLLEHNFSTYHSAQVKLYSAPCPTTSLSLPYSKYKLIGWTSLLSMTTSNSWQPAFAMSFPKITLWQRHSLCCAQWPSTFLLWGGRNFSSVY